MLLIAKRTLMVVSTNQSCKMLRNGRKNDNYNNYVTRYAEIAWILHDYYHRIQTVDKMCYPDIDICSREI